MKAIVFDSFGGPDVLKIAEVEVPQPGPGQVRLRVRAAGVNQLDFKIRQGLMQQAFPVAFPATPGVEAAALPTAGETSQRVLDLLALEEGETLLVHGAAGAVGGMTVQLAIGRGATVIGTAGPANQDYLRALGVIPVVYGDGLVERVRTVAPHGVDAVFDVAGQGALPASIELRGGTDRIITIADPTGPQLGVQFSSGGAPSAQGLADLAAGALQVTIAHTYPLAGAGRAQEQSATGRTRGKLVIHP